MMLGSFCYDVILGEIALIQESKDNHLQKKSFTSLECVEIHKNY